VLCVCKFQRLAVEREGGSAHLASHLCRELNSGTCGRTGQHPVNSFDAACATPVYASKSA
jgi:hypothetical protein